MFNFFYFKFWLFYEKIKENVWQIVIDKIEHKK